MRKTIRDRIENNAYQEYWAKRLTEKIMDSLGEDFNFMRFIKTVFYIMDSPLEDFFILPNSEISCLWAKADLNYNEYKRFVAGLPKEFLKAAGKAMYETACLKDKDLAELDFMVWNLESGVYDLKNEQVAQRIEFIKNLSAYLSSARSARRGDLN